MKILFHLGHPAHFHLFKNTFNILTENNHKILIVIKKKDVLEQLLIDSNIPYINILPTGRKNNILGLSVGLIAQDFKLFKICRKQRPDLLIGTSIAISHVGFLLNIPSLNFTEDDAEAVPLYYKLAYPTATNMITPESCDNSKWTKKSIFYNGYHELAYLSPKYFKPDLDIVQKYISIQKPYFILRFAQLTAHHDKGIKGINKKIAKNLITLLKPYGNIYISSERELEQELEEYRLDIRSNDIHHILAFAHLYIGDSQTMAAETAVLGTPAIRFNDFVGKLGYLDELEHKYGLTYGFRTNESDKMYKKINYLLKQNNLKKQWIERKETMLSDKIDVTAYLVWLIENYPDSIKILEENSDYQYNFKRWD